MTVAEITHILSAVYPPQEAQDLAFWLLEELTGLSRADISAGKGTKNISNIEIFLSRLLKKEPIQYIFGHTLWFGLDLLVNSDTLIPRPETAELVELVLKTLTTYEQNLTTNDPYGEADRSSDARLERTTTILDIGTGSGCIALKLKQRRPDWNVIGLDISESALSIARQNALRNNLDVNFIQADILSNSEAVSLLTAKRSNSEAVYCIVSNPPYICDSEKADMDSNVLDYEPHTALFVPDDDPLRFYRAITAIHAPWLFFEVNSRFASDVAQLMTDNGYSDVTIHNDIYGKQRMVSGRSAI